MCIRDRRGTMQPGGVGCPELGEYTGRNGHPFGGCDPAPWNGASCPVSYTHLDVYKRQEFRRLLFWLKGRQRSMKMIKAVVRPEKCDQVLNEL